MTYFLYLMGFKMTEDNLIQYLFCDGSETITNQEGKVVAVKDPDTKYLPWENRFVPKVQGSVPSLDNMQGFSRTPKVGEYLISFKGVLIFGR